MKYNETDFAKIVASQGMYSEIFGKVEVAHRFKGKLIRIDIETMNHAYECKFGADCWKSAIGQALSYSMIVMKNAGIVVFIRTNPKFHDRDMKGYEILMKTIKAHRLPIDVERFYVNQKDGKISRNNSLKWEVEVTKFDADKLDAELKTIENENKVHKGIFSFFNK